MLDRGFFLTLEAIRPQLAAMPWDLYLIRLIHHGTRRVFPGEPLWTAARLTEESAIRFLSIRNREGYDVSIQPYSEDHNAGYFLTDLDQGDASVLEEMRGSQIEVSPRQLSNCKWHWNTDNLYCQIS